MKTVIKDPGATRRRILDSAFEEFYHHGFQGGSLNRIVERAETTKGALFHHYKGKNDLGHAVIDQIIGGQVRELWIEPMGQSSDPVEDLKSLLRKCMAQSSENQSEGLCNGCPLNNLAQEMSGLDDSFRTRLNKIYDDWRQALADAFQRGIQAGNVRKSVSPDAVAAFVVAGFTGTIGCVKNAQSIELMYLITEELFRYLDFLKA
jgi:AcrR family transcriptional regulator